MFVSACVPVCALCVCPSHWVCKTTFVKYHTGNSITDYFSQNSPDQKGTVALHV